MAVIGSLVTGFTGVAGVGELFGLTRSLTLPLAAAALLFIVASGSYKRVERAALAIGLFELAFFVVAWSAHPGLAALARDATDLPIGNRGLCPARRDDGVCAHGANNKRRKTQQKLAQHYRKLLPK